MSLFSSFHFSMQGCRIRYQLLNEHLGRSRSNSVVFSLSSDGSLRYEHRRKKLFGCLPSRHHHLIGPFERKRKRSKNDGDVGLRNRPGSFQATPTPPYVPDHPLPPGGNVHRAHGPTKKKTRGRVWRPKRACIKGSGGSSGMRGRSAAG
jgi:hypothetical protein